MRSSRNEDAAVAVAQCIRPPLDLDRLAFALDAAFTNNRARFRQRIIAGVTDGIPKILAMGFQPCVKRRQSWHQDDVLLFLLLLRPVTIWLMSFRALILGNR